MWLRRILSVPAVLCRGCSAVPALGQYRRNRSSVADAWEDDAVAAAAAVVGQPPSPMVTLQGLIRHERAPQVAILWDQLATVHPFSDTAREMAQESLGVHGLLPLLLSRAFGLATTSRQHRLAEVAQMMHFSSRVHEGLRTDEDLVEAQRSAILVGDYFLSNTIVALASLKNIQVYGLLCGALTDFAQADFVPLPRGIPSLQSSVEYWQKTTFLRFGSLLSRTCEAMLLIEDNTHKPLEVLLTTNIGKHLSLAWKARLELQPLLSLEEDVDHLPSNGIDEESLPVLLHATIVRMARGCSGGNSLVENDNEILLQDVVAHGEGIERSLQVVQEHCKQAHLLLQTLPASEARGAVSDLAAALQRPAALQL